MKPVFVFGSNLAGRHEKGSALEALRHQGAKYGQGEGRQGNSYAIPTKDRKLNVLYLSEIETHVNTFIFYAESHPELAFNIVKIGCGLAGYNEDQISSLFKNVPPNCNLPDGWRI